MSKEFYTKFESCIWKATRNLIRDYSELEHLQSGGSNLGNFLERSKIKTKEILLRELELARASNISDKLEKIPVEDGTHYFISEIDGLENFARAWPFFGFGVLALTINYGKIGKMSAILSFPGLMQNFFAETGSGAWSEKLGDRADGSQIRLRARKNFDPKNAFVNKQFAELNDKDFNVRDFHCELFDITCLASGRFDAIKINGQNLFAAITAEVFAIESGAMFERLENGDVVAGHISLVKKEN